MGTSVTACHVPCDAEFQFAGTAEHGWLAPFRLRPDFYRVVCQSLMAVFAGIVDAAALHPDCNDVQFRPIVSAARLRVEINPTNFG